MERFLIEEQSEIIVDRGLGDILPARSDRERLAVLTQPGAVPIAQLVADGVSSVEVHELTLPDRDEAKTLAVAHSVYEWLAEVGIDRHDTIAGVGGGADHGDGVGLLVDPAEFGNGWSGPHGGGR